MRRLALLLAWPLLTTGCFLPMSTGAPQSATTLGKGHLGATAYAEFPSVNLTATAPASSASKDQSDKAISLSVSGVVQGSYGLRDDLDLELGLEGMLYLFLFPIPTGGHAGVRYQVLETDTWKIATAGRASYLTFSARAQGEEQRIYALSGMLSGVVQLTRLPIFQPSLALSLYPSSVHYRATGIGVGRTTALAGAATLNVTLDFGYVELSPYVGAVAFTSERFTEPALLPQLGLAFAIRGGKSSQSPFEQARARMGTEPTSPSPAPGPPRAP